ncbi:murein hydrolase activator EnvC family protein [Novosphingobium sp.]|uniref:murein hydrolase activator EnvC family protein n=1 Tax=Novosphingobium sp. TaxID=1874826 RepID=UPI003B524F86
MRALSRYGIPVALGIAVVLAGTALALDAPYADRGEAGAALNQATRALADVRTRAVMLDREAAAANQAADHTARETAAIAARIQQAEAEIALAHARIAVIDRDRADLRASIAQREQPLVRLTAALQMMARRPLAFSLMRADSLRETVWLRATLETMLPEVAQRTAALRAEIAHGRQLQDQARALAAGLEASQHDLGARQKDLAATESRQRIASRAATGDAGREADRALALAEQTRDLGSLVTQLERDDTLGRRLAALPGPLPRPSNMGPLDSGMASAEPGHMLMVERADSGPPLIHFTGILPVTGRLLGGFGETGATGPAHGITLAPSGGAQAVSPAAGRIAFAGPYNGYARIVIIAHDNGWSSLITGLGRIDVAVGDTVVQGAPLGVAEPGHPRVMVELRRDGNPVNPMEFLHP